MSKEIKVALLAIVGSCLLYFGYFFLRGRNVFSSEQFYTSIFENVDLLVAGDQVLLNGMQVGQIYSTDLDLETGLITVDFTLQKGIKIPVGSSVVIFNADLLGDKALKFVLPASDKITSFHELGDTIPGTVEKGMTDMLTAEILPLKDQVAQMLVSVDTILNGVNAILATKQLDSTLHSMNVMSKNLALASNGMDKTIKKLTTQLQGIMTNVEGITNTMSKNQGNIDNIIGNTASITQDFTQLSKKMSQLEIEATLQSVQKTLENANNAVLEANTLLNKLNNGSGTASAILNDRSIYDNLDKVTANLDALLVDLKENPKNYVHFSLIDRTAKIEAKEKRRAEKAAQKAD